MASAPLIYTLAGCSTLFFGAASWAAVRRLSDEKAGYSRFLLVTGGIGVLINVTLLVMRWAESQAPAALSSNFDVMILTSSLVVLLGLVCLFVGKLRGLEGMLLPIAWLAQVVAWIKFDPERVGGQYQSWFFVHMASLAIGAVCFTLTGVTGMAYLALTRVLRKKTPSPLFGKFAPLESIERFERWSLLIGWPIFSFGILAGICEVAQDEHPARYLTDPLVIFTFLTWLAYAALMVTSWLKPSFRGRRSARWASFALALLAFTFFVGDIFSHVHQ